MHAALAEEVTAADAAVIDQIARHAERSNDADAR